MTQSQRPPVGRAGDSAVDGPGGISPRPRSTGSPPSARLSSKSSSSASERSCFPRRSSSWPGTRLRPAVPATRRTSWAREFLIDGLTVGYVLALTQFIMVWDLAAMVPAQADRDFDPLAERAAAVALEAAARATAGEGRFDREPAGRSRRGGAAPMTFIAAVNEARPRRSSRVVVRDHAWSSPISPRSGSRRATDFWAAGRGLTGPQNGFAIAGDYMSAASFLGIAGLIFLFGFDGFLYSVGFLVAFLTVLFLLAERMRNSGKYTIADVLSFRLNERPARCGGRARHAVRGRLLPDRPDGRRRRADRGARGHRLLARGAPHGRLHDHLHRRGRHARHELGADHQGLHADDGRRS